MKHLTILASVLFLAPVAVFGSADSIRQAYSNIDDDYKRLNTTVNNFKDVLTYPPVAVQLTRTIAQTDSGTRTAQQSSPLTSTEAFSLANPLFELVDDTIDALNNIQGKAGLFKSTGTALGTRESVRLAKVASDRFEAAVREKVPRDLVDPFMQITAPLDPAYDRTIAALS